MAEVKDKLVTVESAKIIHDSLNNKFIDVVYSDEEGVYAPAEVINADTLGGYSSSDFRHSDWMPTAEEVGARPDNWMPSASDVGAASMDYAKKVGNPHNLLDNSDFTNPVNQRGYVSGTVGSANYTIDRWKLQYNTYLHLHSGYVGISGFWTLTQLVGCKMFAGKTYTFSVEAKSEADNGNMFVRLGDPTGTGAKEHRQAVNSNGWTKCVKTWTADRDYEPGECDFSFGINTGNELTTQIYYKNPAVYEGEYTAETLPEYQPKGYGAELAECQRYFYAIKGANYSKAGFGPAEGNNAVYPLVYVPVPMRVRPTITYSGNWKLFDGSTEIAITSVSANAGSTSVNDCPQVSLMVTSSTTLTLSKLYTLTVRGDGAAYLWLSADL